MKLICYALMIRVLILGRGLAELLMKGTIAISLTLVLILAAMVLTSVVARLGLMDALLIVLLCEFIALAVPAILKGDQ